jgi:type I restriction enzyme S subunit
MKNTPHPNPLPQGAREQEVSPFDLAAFVAQFPLFARAPNGIANLRALILQLAVQGKLTEQNPDETVNIIKNSDEKLAFGRGKELPKIKTSEQAFSIPKNWQWMRLGSIGHNHGQKQPTSEFTYIDVSAIDNHTGSIVNAELVSAELAPSRARKIVKKGTLVYSTVRPYLLNIAILETEFTPEPIASTAFAIIHPFEGIDIRFIYFFLRSPQFVTYVEKVQQGVAYPAINDEKFFRGICPIPPLEEQQRIVAKVDELMALCDQLEAQQDDQARNLLEANTAVVQAVMQPADAFNQHWQRIATHFNTLYGTNLPLPSDMRRGKLKERTVALQNITKLRQVILQLSYDGFFFSTNQTITKKPLKHLISFGPRNGFSPKPTEVFSEIRVLKQGATTSGQLILSESKMTDADISADSYLWIRKDDILIQRGNSASYVGSNIWIKAQVSNYIYPDLMMKIRTNQEVMPEYLSLCLSANSSRKYMWDRMTGTSGTMPKISKKIVEEIPIPTPPLAEQQRIVAQVDALMALCDTLETLLDEQRQVATAFSAAAMQAMEQA